MRRETLYHQDTLPDTSEYRICDYMYPLVNICCTSEVLLLCIWMELRIEVYSIIRGSCFVILAHSPLGNSTEHLVNKCIKLILQFTIHSKLLSGVVVRSARLVAS